MYRKIDDGDWVHAELRPDDVLLKEIMADELSSGSITLHKHKLATRMFQVVKLGTNATKIDPRLQLNKVVLPIIEIMRYASNSGYFVINAEDIALTWPSGLLEDNK